MCLYLPEKFVLEISKHSGSATLKMCYVFQNVRDTRVVLFIYLFYVRGGAITD